MQTVKNYFKEFFKDDIGTFNPEAKKLRGKDVVYWVIGLILSFIIPACLLYLEAWEFRFNLFSLIWTGNPTEYLPRGGYFLLGTGSNVLFLIVGYLTAYKINGKQEDLDFKKEMRMFWFLSIVACITCYIISLIIY